MSPKTRTQTMVEILQEAEAVLAVLDQYSGRMGPPLSRAYLRMYEEIAALRDAELREWNEEASSGLRDVKRILYRCDNAERPYHISAEDGPCEIYTPNMRAAEHICDTCRKGASRVA